MLFISAGRSEHVRENVSVSRTPGRNILGACPESCNDSFANHYEKKSSNGKETSAQRIGNDESDSSASSFRESFFRRIDASSCTTRGTTAARGTTSYKSRIYENVATARRRRCITAAMTGGICGDCIKGISRLRNFRKNCEGFLQFS